MKDCPHYGSADFEARRPSRRTVLTMGVLTKRPATVMKDCPDHGALTLRPGGRHEGLSWGADFEARRPSRRTVLTMGR